MDHRRFQDSEDGDPDDLFARRQRDRLVDYKVRCEEHV
jgi:hypothetical protein